MRALAGQTVLVTGASGFIGSRLCDQITKGGADVHGVSRHSRAADGARMHWWNGDLSDETVVKHLLTTIRPDVIFHLASCVAGTRDVTAVLPTFQSNLASTVHLLTAATAVGCRRLVLAGSLEEPDPGEGDPTPVSPYAAAKWASSGYARMFHALYGTPVVTARLFMVYGPGQQDMKKLVPYVILSLLRREPLRLSSGTRPVDWIYVDDVVAGLVAAALAPDVLGAGVDIGSGRLVTVREITERLVAMIDPEARPAFGAIGDRPLERLRVADTATASARLDWAPRVGLDDGLGRTVEWYRGRLEEGGIS